MQTQKDEPLNTYLVRIPVQIEVEMWVRSTNGEAAIYEAVERLPKELTKDFGDFTMFFNGFGGEAQSKKVKEN